MHHKGICSESWHKLAHLRYLCKAPGKKKKKKKKRYINNKKKNDFPKDVESIAAVVI